MVPCKKWSPVKAPCAPYPKPLPGGFGRVSGTKKSRPLCTLDTFQAPFAPYIPARMLCKDAVQGCCARMLCKDAVQGCCARMLCKDAVQGCCARMLCKDAVQGCCARMLCKDAVQGCCARMLCKDAVQGCCARYLRCTGGGFFWFPKPCRNLPEVVLDMVHRGHFTPEKGCTGGFSGVPK